jgi:aryl-alcohol dehydrogenase-like predicted oxidoreductase
MSDLPSRALGHSGIKTSIVGLGCNNFGRRLDIHATRQVVDSAIDAGVTFFDTADVYGRGESEEQLGRLLEGRRDQVVLATKFGMDMGDGKGPRGSREYIRQAVENSLRRLRTDVIDVYWYHRPDGETPIAETLGALHELVTAGTVRAIGASNFSATEIEEAETVARDRGFTRFTAVQNEYSLLKREAERDVLPACERLGLGFVPFFPLASGLLTGKYRRGEDAPAGTRLAGRDQVASAEEFEQLEGLTAFAEDRGVPLLDVAFGGLLVHDAVSSVIAGATKPDQVRANAGASTWTPTAEDRDELARVLGEPA